MSHAAFAGGQWTVEAQIENGVDGIRKPIDLFTEPTVVRGSPEEAQLRERLRTNMVEKLRERLAAERQ